MADYATDAQFARAGRILRKLMYKNTIPEEDRPENIPYFNYHGTGSKPTIGVEGHKMVYIQIGMYTVKPEQIEAIRNVEDIKERDSIQFTEDGFKLYVNSKEMTQE